MAYHGVKFKTKIVKNSYPISNQIVELISWCNLFAKNRLAPSHPEGTYGNLSIRFNDGILITATSLDLGKELQYSDFIYVQNCDFDFYEMTVWGNRAPSSETPIHWTMYKMRPEINAVFHGHHDSLLTLAKELQIPETASEQDYGSLALVNEVKLLANYDFFNMKNHGFISMGKTMENAGNLALSFLDKLAKFTN